MTISRQTGEQASDALSLVRGGTWYFARRLGELSNPELQQASAVDGCSRAHIVAAVALHARSICWQIEYPEDPGVASAYLADIETSATLPPHALRCLFTHTAIHLDAVWRDLSDRAWEEVVTGLDGHPRPMRDLVEERARLVWRSAIDLVCGERPSDFPRELGLLCSAQSMEH